MTEFISDKYTDKVMELVEAGKSIFVTGKAGTGKTMLLKRILAEMEHRKKTVVCAPTGVAANHAGGATIHSLLKLPIGIYLPGHKMRDLYNLNVLEEEMVRRIDLMIIDEISMVRCDTMDMMDDILRHYRENELPFGGIQMVFFGDMRQLMPVAKDEDWEKLSTAYKKPYFFCSEVMRRMQIPMIELMTVHRQSNTNFISLLNNIREGILTYDDEKLLNSKYNEEFTPASDHYIRLTTHRYKAHKINEERLSLIPSPVEEFKAFIDGYISKEDFPADYRLHLKYGAKVMFIANDPDKQYYNGSIGKVSSVSNSDIYVRLENGKEIKVERFKWDFYSYKINKATKELERYLIGSFNQYPLRLAWAITIHKSQGLTFDKVIIDAGRAFTYGQVYVALSRCRTLNGMVLTSRITSDKVEIDPVITEYLQLVKRIWVDDEPRDSNAGNDSAVTAFLEENDYSPVGHVFRHDKNNQLYDVWEDASGYMCLERIVRKDDEYQRLLVGMYKEGTVPFKILDAREFSKIRSIQYSKSLKSVIEICDDENSQYYKFFGNKTPEPQHIVKDVIEDSNCIDGEFNREPNLRRYNFEKEGDSIKIVKISTSSTIPSTIKNYSDLGKLILCCDSFTMLRNDNLHYTVAVDENDYTLCQYTLDGRACDHLSKKVADKWYQQNGWKSGIKKSYEFTPQPAKTVKDKKKSRVAPSTTGSPAAAKATSPTSTPRQTTPSRAPQCAAHDYSPSSLQGKIIRCLRYAPRLKARDIAKSLVVERKEVNRILHYELLKRNIVVNNGDYWSLL